MLRNGCLSGLVTLLAVFGLALIITPHAVAGSKYRVLHAFTGKPDGGGVYAGVVIDGEGNLYGTTWAGGAYGEGTVFQLTPGSGGKWTERILYSFCPDGLPCRDGLLPTSGVAFDSAGNLYGTAGGGVGNSGVTFELSPDSASPAGWRFRVIYDGGSDIGLVLDNVGDLYGVLGAGKYGEGAISELLPGSDGWTETFLYSFCPKFPCSNGVIPHAGLTWDTAGNLYGTTQWGGNYPPQCPGSAGCGVAFKLEALGGKWKYHVLHRFAAFKNDGQLPFAGVTVGGKGNVYGTTLYSGTSSGTVFELSPQQKGSWKETILYNFPNAGKNGGAPVGGVTFDNLGNLFGTASAGGDPTCSCGVVFKMTPQADGKWTYSVLHRFKGTDGYGPGYNLIFDKSYKHLYGTTVEGGSGGYGVVYEITP